MFTSLGSAQSRRLGEYGEQFACTYLNRCLGWNILERNVYTRFGEIDAVALASENQYVFVEVRTRSSHRFGSPIETVSDWKLAKLIQQMNYYIARCRLGDHVLCCLDVVGLSVNRGIVQSVEHCRVFP